MTGLAASRWRAANRGSITLRVFGAPRCHVYAPPGGSELCLEPVSHTPDAVNRAPGETTVLPPGAAAGIAIRIEAA
jgi:aldose 1-epimerase